MRAIAILAVLVAGCSSRSERAPAPHREPAAPTQPETAPRSERRASCGAVTAVWRTAADDDEGYELWFDLPERSEPVRFATGDIYDTDWAFDIFSPDCRHVLLLRSHHGPYHIVRVGRLATYLDGGPPDHVLKGEPVPGDTAGTGVFRDGAWVSNTEVSYTWGCCDPPITTRFKLP